MAWIRGALEIFHVATHARRICQRVVVVHVTIRAGAWRHRMQSGEREPGRVVVEGRVGPVAGAMALVAGLREIRGDVIGIRGALEILQVAGNAGIAVQVVIVVHVTIGAGPRWHGVHSGEREPGAVMVELRIHPVAGVMALLAGLREIRSDVVGIGGSLEILQVARHASGIA